MSPTPPVLALPSVSEALAERLQQGLADVDETLRREVDHDDPFIAEAAAHLADAGGKRFRPLLTLLAAEIGTGINPDVVAAATGVELTHLASLYHDDVMDEADVRRGAPSANAKYDNSTAILVGDLLFGTASSIIADLGPEAVKIQAQTFVRLCAGQIRDDRPCPPGVDPVDYYLQVLADKTGVLIATAARYGAMFGVAPRDGGDSARVRRAARHGLPARRRPHRHLVRGRRDGQDARDRPSRGQGHPAGPLRQGLAGPGRCPAQGAAGLRPARRCPPRGDALVLLRGHEAMERAREHTFDVARQAQAALSALPDSEAKAALLALTTGVVTRVG